MKKLSFMSLSVVTVLAFVGCGGSSSSATAAKIGTGYYVDNAVAGVDYVCGSQTGKTDKDGKFIFEEGEACKFSLAGIPLRTTNADELVDGQEVFEDNPKVAQFLQSIDADGDLSNGIQITDEVLTALTTALETSNSAGTLPEGRVLTEVVAFVGHDVKDVSGDVRTDDQVQEHLAQTQTDITKALLAGKTFYVVSKDDGSPLLEKIVVNQDVTELQLFDENDQLFDTTQVNILGDKLTFPNDTDGSYSLISQKDGYIFAEDYNADGSLESGIGHRLYASQSDAQAYFDTVKGEPSESTNKNYTVYGGNIYFSGGFSSMPNNYVLLGQSKVTSTFTGAYKYYVIANENSNYTIYVDALKGSDNKYYSTNTTSNTGDTWQNLEGTPDNKYVSIGGHGYILIDAQNAILNEIEVVLK